MEKGDIQRKGNETGNRKRHGCNREQRESDSWRRDGRKRDDDGRRSNRGGSLGREITHTRPRLNIMRAMFQGTRAREQIPRESERANVRTTTTMTMTTTTTTVSLLSSVVSLSIVALADANARSCIVGAYCTHTRRCSQPRPRPTELA